MPRLISKLIHCPYCRTRVSVYEQECSQCNADISILSEINLMPYALYNEALANYSENNLYGALRKSVAALEMDESLVEARQLLEQIAPGLNLDINQLFGAALPPDKNEALS